MAEPRAVILAAGRGSRMGPETDRLPKGMLELAGRPLLEWQIQTLRQAGVKEVGIVTGYRHEVLEEMARRYGLTTFHNPVWASTQMVASLATAESWLLDGPCLSTYADIVYRPEVVGQLGRSQGALTISYDRQWLALWTLRFDDPLDDAETFAVDPDGRLLEIGGKTRNLSDIAGQYMGLVHWTPEAWRRARTSMAELEREARSRLDMTSLLRRLLSQGMEISTVAVEGGWCEVDSPVDRDRYEHQLTDPDWSHRWF